jgi:hypothetical protein
VSSRADHGAVRVRWNATSDKRNLDLKPAPPLQIDEAPLEISSEANKCHFINGDSA